MSLILTCYTLWMNFAYTFITMSDLFLQLDLAITLAKPLAPQGNRFLFYLTISTIYSVIFAVAVKVSMDLNNPVVKTLFYLLKAAFFLAAIWSISSSLLKFSRGGLSR